MPKSALRSSAVMADWALAKARSVSSQTLDVWETTFSFPLVNVLCLFRRGVSSSSEVAEEVILVALGTEVAGVIGVPFSTTRTTFFLRLERGLFFLAYISWLNLVFISTCPKVRVTKKKKKKTTTTTTTKGRKREERRKLKS